MLLAAALAAGGVAPSAHAITAEDFARTPAATAYREGNFAAALAETDKLLTRERIGRTVELEVLRNGARTKLKLAVTARPEAKAA